MLPADGAYQEQAGNNGLSAPGASRDVRAPATPTRFGPPPSPATIGGIDAALTAWTVQQALASLTPEHRAVLGEVYLRRRTVPEAAAVLGIPESLVKSRTYFALRALRLALEELGVSPASAGGLA